MFLLTTSLLLLTTTLIWIHRRYQSLKLFSRNGIPGPKPNIIWGNIPDFSSHGTIQYHQKLIKEFGPVVGYYLGTVPYLVVADEKLLHEILVSNASIFISRPRRIPGGVNPDPKRKRMLAHLPPEEWKIVRKTLSGMFNPPKLKPQIPNLRRLVGLFMDQLKKTDLSLGGGVNMAAFFESLSLDLIGQTAFGRTDLVQGNSKDPLLLAVRDKYAKPMLAPLNVLNLCFPEFNSLIYPLRVYWQKIKELTGFAGERNATLWEIAQQCLENSLTKHSDNNNLQSNLRYSQFQLLQKAGIHPDLMMAYCVNAFQGDYENVTTTLGFMSQLLIENPSVQERIREEVASVRSDMSLMDGDPMNEDQEYDFFSRLRYMESVIYETLRLWPQTSFVRRSPSEDYMYMKEDGTSLTIPKGVHIQAAHYTVQRMDHVWGDKALEFNPERFFKQDGDRDKVSPNCVTYQGFGSGPRHCMGQKFAILVLKMIMTSILDQYELQRCDESGSLDEMGKTLMTPVTPFYASLVKFN